LVTREDILNAWRHGDTKIDWRKLTTEKEKSEWLQACLSANGLPKEQITSFQWTIDGDHVTSDKDFYCLLGETFFGYGGYFGQDIEGFDDCFSEIYIHNKTKPVVEPGASVVFKNSSRLQEILEQHYLIQITEVFRKHGFVTILD
jgi:RNAse (barnase) inhibitor barstar